MKEVTISLSPKARELLDNDQMVRFGDEDGIYWASKDKDHWRKIARSHWQCAKIFKEEMVKLREEIRELKKTG